MIRKIWSNELWKGTILLLFLFNTYNVLQFVFHFIMARLLEPEGYGILATLMAFVQLMGVPNEGIQTLLSKYSSKFSFQKSNGKIKYLLKKIVNKLLLISFLIFFVSLPLSYIFYKLTQINFYLIILTNTIIFPSLLSPVLKGILQGRKRFFSLGINMLFESGFRLVLGIILVSFGWGVFGAILGTVIALFIGLILSFYLNKDLLGEPEIFEDFSIVKKESIQYFIVTLSILLIFSLDIVLAKIFFDSSTVGQYAVISNLGKIIFFGTIAISKALFPITTEEHYSKKKSNSFFKATFVLLFMCSISILIYYAFPEWIITLLYGKKYLELSYLLFYTAIALSFLSLTNLILIYGLSNDRIKNYYPLLIYVFIGILILLLNHSSIEEYIISFMFSNIVMFIGTLLLFVKWKKN